MSNLFRQEALDAQKVDWTGTVILTRPFSFTFLTFCALGIGLCLLAFLIWGEYTKRSTVKGQLIPEQGLIYSHSPTSGIIIENHAYEGKIVKKGDLLYKISTAHYGDEGSTQAALQTQIELKETLINNQIHHSQEMHRQELKGLSAQIDRLKLDKEKLLEQITLQKTQVKLAYDTLARYQEVLAYEGVAVADVNARQMELNTQNERLSALERELGSLNKQIQEQVIALERTRQSQKSTINALAQSLSDNRQSNIQNKAGEHIAVYAPVDGVISTSAIKIGQFTDSSRSLLTLLPNNSQMIAELYVPSHAIGFVKTGDAVLMRYNAYPYQKFGHAKGMVISVAKSALPAQTLATIGTVASSEQMSNEPVYVVRASLDKTNVKAYGNELPLQVGMTLESDILHETRKLYEWVLEPLYSITGKI